MKNIELLLNWLHLGEVIEIISNSEIPHSQRVLENPHPFSQNCSILYKVNRRTFRFLGVLSTLIESVNRLDISETTSLGTVLSTEISISEVVSSGRPRFLTPGDFSFCYTKVFCKNDEQDEFGNFRKVTDGKMSFSRSFILWARTILSRTNDVLTRLVWFLIELIEVV